MKETNIIDDCIVLITQFFQTYGWMIVFTCIAYYFAQPYINEYSRRRSLEQANDPKRRAVLDEERKKARIYQQLDVYRANREANEAEGGASSRYGGKIKSTT